MDAPDLAYVALAVREPQRLADVFERDLGLPRDAVRAGAGEQVPALGVGATTLLLFDADGDALGAPGPPGLHHIAIAAPDSLAALERSGLRGAAVAGGGPAGAGQVELEPATTSGVRTRLSEPLAAPRGASPAVERIDHIGIASADNVAATRVFAGALGCVVESTQTDFEVRTPIESFTSDKYGVVYHSRPPEPVGGLRVSFLTVGDCELELLQPFAPRVGAEPGDGRAGDRPGNTRGDKNAIGRYIERRGAGLHHLALKTPDIDATLARLAAAGHRLIDRTGRPGSRRARIGFVHPASLGGLLLHFVERDEL